MTFTYTDTEFSFKVIDNFLSEKYYQMIKNEVFGNEFTWKYRDNITYELDPKVFSDWNALNNLNINYEYGFYHEIYYDGQSYSYLNLILSSFYASLMEETQTNRVMRCRLDMVTYSPDKYKHFPHVDFFEPHLSAVFYLTDSDAETILYDLKCSSFDDILNIDVNTLKELTRIEPKENRVVIFNGLHLHTGQSPSKSKKRILINTNLSL